VTVGEELSFGMLVSARFGRGGRGFGGVLWDEVVGVSKLSP